MISWCIRKNENDHIAHLRVELQVLKEHKLFSMYRKYEFWLRLVTFLGHIISSEVVEVDAKKIEAVRNWPRSLAINNIRSFLVL